MKTGNLFLKMTVAAGISFIVACNKSDSDEAMAANPVANSPNSALAANTGGSANNAQWTTLEAQNFTVNVPASWRYMPRPTIDTYNGMLGDSKDSMTYEYGIKPDTFRIDPERFAVRYETVDGRRAKILSGERYGLVIDDMGDPSKPQRRFVLMQASNAPMSEEMAVQILRSVRFK